MPPEPPEGRVRVASMTSARQRVLSDTLLSVSRAYSAPPLSRSHMSWALCSVFRCWHVGFVTAKHRVGCISAGVVAVSGFNLESLSMMNHHHRFESCNRESGARGRRATLPPYQPAPAPTADGFGDVGGFGEIASTPAPAPTAVDAMASRTFACQGGATP